MKREEKKVRERESSGGGVGGVIQSRRFMVDEESQGEVGPTLWKGECSKRLRWYVCVAKCL